MNPMIECECFGEYEAVEARYRVAIGNGRSRESTRQLFVPTNAVVVLRDRFLKRDYYLGDKSTD